MYSYTSLINELRNNKQYFLAEKLMELDDNYDKNNYRMINKELYLLFLSIIPEEVKEKIEMLKFDIINLKKSIMDNSGWETNIDMFSYQSNLLSHDFSLDMGYEIAYIVREEDGYKILEDFKSSLRENYEKRFIIEYNSELSELHNKINEYDLLFKNSIDYVDDNSKELVREILLFLGCEIEKKKEL